MDIWKDTYGSYPPTVGDSICGASKPTLTGAHHTTDTALTGWNTSVSAGDVLYFHIDSLTAITQLSISLKIRRT